MARLNPHLVVSGEPSTVDPGGVGGAPEKPDEPSEACASGRRRSLKNTGFEELPVSFDQAEALLRDGRELGGC